MAIVGSQRGEGFDASVAQVEMELLPETTSTRIEELLASNLPPLESERVLLADLMSRTQCYATSLDTRIASLRASLKDLLAQKSATEQRLRDLKVILHPIRTVPAEILAEIFDEAVSDSALVPPETVRDGDFANSIETSSQGCVISEVSSTWRRTALKTQRLWRFVHVSLDRYPHNLSTSLFLHDFLARSAGTTLHVMLHATVDHPAMTVLLMSSKRWQTAAISFPPPIYQSWNVPNLSFRALEKLHLHLQLDGIHTMQDLRAGNRTFRLDAPRLQFYSSDTARAILAVIRPKYSRLIHFEQAGTLDEKLDDGYRGVSCLGPILMISLPSLTSAVFHVPKEVSDLFYNTILISHPADAYPNMRALRLVGTSAGYRSFLFRFPLPCLETLSLEDSERGGHPSFPSPLIAPTGQSLMQLKVSLQTADDTNRLIAFLRTTPKLCQLELMAKTHFDISNTIQAVLVDAEGLLPDLTNLVITSQDPDGVEISGAFVDAIEHRRYGESQVAKLQEVCVNQAAEIGADVVAAFNDLLSDGLRGGLRFVPT